MGGWTGGRASDYNATSWPPTDQLKLNRGQLSWSVGVECGKNPLGQWQSVRKSSWVKGFKQNWQYIGSVAVYFKTSYSISALLNTHCRRRSIRPNYLK